MKDEGLATFRAHYLQKFIQLEGEMIVELLGAYLVKLKEDEIKKPTKTNPIESFNVEDDSEELDSEDDKLLDFVASVRRLFEFLAGCIEDKQPFLEKYFGHDSIKPITETIQLECDKYITKILQTFIEHYNIQEMVRNFLC